MRIFLVLLAMLLPAHSWAKEQTLVIIGDSLTEGYGITKEEAFPNLLEAKLKAAGKNWKVLNSGVSGSTSASAPGRVSWALKSKPEAILIALGANDGLRGLKTSALESNLIKAVTVAKSSGAKVFLAGMQMPPNYGIEYTKEFREVFPKVAKKEKVELLPFLLDKVAGQPKLNLADGIHPNEAGHKILAKTVFEFLKDKL